jgi:hypothetical protein
MCLAQSGQCSLIWCCELGYALGMDEGERIMSQDWPGTAKSLLLCKKERGPVNHSSKIHRIDL